MEISYNKTGAERKALVMAVSEILGYKTKYKGAPSFAYEVGGCAIDKNGMLTGKDNPDLVADLQGLYSFKAVSEEYDVPLPKVPPVPDTIRIPYEANLGGRVSPYRDFEEPPAYGTPDTLVIQMPRDHFTNAALGNLRHIIDIKSDLIKKAIGANVLPIEVTDENVSFPWFSPQGDAAAVRAYTHFVTALCDMAKTQQRVNASEKPVDNEKYAFRCFLLRLGFIGSEYKAERKILLSKLNGSSAFKNPISGGADNE